MSGLIIPDCNIFYQDGGYIKNSFLILPVFMGVGGKVGIS